MADASFDFFSPFFRAAIITDPKNREGSRWPLWVFGSEKDSQSLSQTQAANGLGALAYCTDITVKLGLSYIPVITVTLSPPIHDARLFLDSPLIEYAKGAEGSSILEVVFGYTNGPDGESLSPPFEGSIVSPPSVSFGAEASITLNAQGTGGFDASRVEISNIFEKKKRVAMMEEVLKSLNLKVDRSEVSPDSPEGKALDEEIQVAFPANGVAWWFVVSMAVACGCWVTLTKKGEDSVIKLTAVNKVLSDAPKTKFRFYDFAGGFDSKQGVFPILGISTQTQAVFMSGAAAGLRTMSMDSKTREIKEGVVNEESATPKRTAPGTVATTTDTIKGELFSENVADPAMAAKAKEAFKQAQGTMGVKIEIETIGIPTLVPGAFISVVGVAKRLDQNYIVQEVEHSVGSGGFTTKFTAQANVSPLSGASESSRLNSAIRQAIDTNEQTKNEKEPQATSSSTVTVEPKVVDIDLSNIEASIALRTLR